VTAASEARQAEARPSWLMEQLLRQRGFGVLWFPVFLLFGIWIYFALPAEPSALVCGLFLTVLMLMAVLAALGRRSMGFMAISLLLAGFLLAKLEVIRAETPLLPATTPELSLRGTVERIDRRGGARSVVIVQVNEIAGIDPSYVPRRLRMSLSKTPPSLAPGVLIEGRAFLRPLPVPVIPGGFDFGRQLYLQGIGGVGRFSGTVTIIDETVRWNYWLRARIFEVRQSIGQKIQAAMAGGQGAFAEALITGERGGIPKAVNESLQTSGLAHILSISGLHMSLVAGGVFWLVRAVLALSVTLALHWPIKKWAAGAALLAGFGYMMLAGADVATQRSYVMLGVIFLAVIFDRPALSMRNLVLAALIILVTQPSSALSASFHMSFMAVMGLAAFYEAYGRWKNSRHRETVRGPAWRMINSLGSAVLAMAFTTLVAGTLSSIPAAFHFGRIAPMSLLANLLALPVVSLVVMPAATISVVLMPFGLEYLPLRMMGLGLDLVIQISDAVSGLAGARVVVPLLPTSTVIVMSLGMIWLCLWRGRLRYAGIAVSIIGLLLGSSRVEPDIIVDATASNVAVRNVEGELVPADGRRARFGVEKWLQAEGDDLSPSQSFERPGWSCEGLVCEAKVKAKRVVFVREGADAAEACKDRDVVIADFPLRGDCKGVHLRIDRIDVWREGAYAITIHPAGFSVVTSRVAQGDRPWRVKPVARRKLHEAGASQTDNRGDQHGQTDRIELENAGTAEPPI
jgi:competence protein ComEC